MRRYRIGRAETNDIVLRDASVSREHAELIKLTRGAFLIKDLGSTYGTCARQGADWHLVTAENVEYTTPIRIGEVETTVAELLREVDPLAVYMEPPPTPPWEKAEPRLSPELRAQHPETTHVGWGPGAAPAPLFAPNTGQTPAPATAKKRLAVFSMIGLGAIAVATLIVAAFVPGAI